MNYNKVTKAELLDLYEQQSEQLYIVQQQLIGATILSGFITTLILITLTRL